MPYHNCPRCGLAISSRSDRLAPEHCPRCLARRQVAVPMYTAPHPMRVTASTGILAAAGSDESSSRVSPELGIDTAA